MIVHLYLNKGCFTWFGYGASAARRSRKVAYCVTYTG
jgi:hypothetical protein